MEAEARQAQEKASDASARAAEELAALDAATPASLDKVRPIHAPLEPQIQPCLALYLTLPSYVTAALDKVRPIHAPF